MTLPAKPYPRIRRRDSIIVRVIALCVVLVLCLLGSIYVLTLHYFGEITQQMEARTEEIAQSVVVRLETNPNANLEDVASGLQEIHDGVRLDIAPASGGTESTAFRARAAEGAYVLTASHTFTAGGQLLQLTADFVLKPQTEIVRAFKNKYMLALAVVFILALGLMVYLIARLLRPLRELSESCKRIMKGKLELVRIGKNSGEVLALEQTFNAMVGSLREKELVEANLRQAQRLSAIGTLAAGVAHDVRNPLNAIKLLSSHTLDSLDNQPDPAAAVKPLRTIRKEVDRLEEIITRFLSLAKETELKPEPNRIDDLLEECLRLVRKNAEARRVQLVNELRAGDTTLMLDPKQWTRAMLNVLINAMEACPEGGRVRLFSRVTDTACEIEVRDDGPGMPKDVLERAFDPYFTTKDTGTGLGLSLTRGIVEEHGGAIALSSSEGHGCQVLIRLPLNTEPQ